MSTYPIGALLIVHPGHISGATSKFTRRVRYPYGSEVFDLESGPRVWDARNALVREALEELPNLNWVLFVDSDEDCRDYGAIQRLIDWEKPLVSGTVCERGTPFNLPAYTSLNPPTRVPLATLPDDGLVSIVACGTGFLYIERRVLDALGDPWFRVDGVHHGVALGHDLDFTYRAHLAGFSPFLDAGLYVGHHFRGTVWPGRRKDRRPWVSVSGVAEGWYPAGAPAPRVPQNGSAPAVPAARES